MNELELSELSRKIRIRVLNMIRAAGEGHIGSAFSIVELLVALYFGVLRIDPTLPDWIERDRLILSKGHGSAALYAVLAERGYFPTAWLKSFLAYETRFPAHPDMQTLPGIDINSGSLGQGLSLGVGMALAARLNQANYRTFVVLGDGELNEGMTWEAAIAASHFKLGSLVAIVDRNRIQIDGDTESVMSLEPLTAKWTSFGWSTVVVDGHNIDEICKAFINFPQTSAKPTAIIALTVKGKGVSFMENALPWHYRAPTKEEFNLAFKELEHK